jgi:hypothetical protein
MTSWTIRRYARAVDGCERHGALGIPGRQPGESREDARRRVAAALFAVWRRQLRGSNAGSNRGE